MSCLSARLTGRIHSALTHIPLVSQGIRTIKALLSTIPVALDTIKRAASFKGIPGAFDGATVGLGTAIVTITKPTQVALIVIGTGHGLVEGARSIGHPLLNGLSKSCMRVVKHISQALGVVVIGVHHQHLARQLQVETATINPFDPIYELVFFGPPLFITPLLVEHAVEVRHPYFDGYEEDELINSFQPYGKGLEGAVARIVSGAATGASRHLIKEPSCLALIMIGSSTAHATCKLIDRFSDHAPARGAIFPRLEILDFRETVKTGLVAYAAFTGFCMAGPLGAVLAGICAGSSVATAEEIACDPDTYLTPISHTFWQNLHDSPA